MAGLPPRPKSPLTPASTRDRAQPLAPRFRDERPPERERTYVPRPPPRPSDSYIPSYRPRREADSRRDFDDRPRDRFRDQDRRDRGPRRDWDPHSRRRDSPDRDRDRDRRPSYRGHPPRRPYPSPRRGPYRRDSRSRSPRRPSRSPRRFSRSPRRYRSRTRSRSRSPRRSPAKEIRLGEHSITTTSSPRTRSPPKQFSRSGSPAPRPPTSEPSTEEPETKGKSPRRSPVPTSVEVAPSPALEQLQIKKEEKDDTLSPNLLHQEVSTIEKHDSPQPAQPPSSAELPRTPKIEPPEPRIEVVKPEPAPESTKVEEPPSTKMDVDPPKSLPPPIHAPPSRQPPLGPANRGQRSPPRGPRNHPSYPHTQFGQSYTDSRPPKRSKPPTLIHHHGANYLPGPGGEKIIIPEAPKHQPLIDMEIALSRTRRAGFNTANDIVQQLKGLPRKMHELELATLELKVAEMRRKGIEGHLEKAKMGVLGIDYVDTD